MSVTTDNKDLSSFESAAHAKLKSSWEITCDLWGTALDVRKLKGRYLLQFNKEPPEKFAERLNQSVFESKFRGSIETMAGMAFRTDPKPDGINPEIEALLPDIDLCGNSFWAFNLDGFEKFLRDGNGFIYIDAPVYEPQVNDAGEEVAPTLADRAGDRPFWVFYAASQVLNYREDQIGSRNVLTQVTIQEETMEADGDFGEKPVIRHRILRPGSVEIRTENPTTKEFDTEGEVRKVAIKDYIPLVPIDEFDATPPLLTMAMLNSLLYNKTSDYDQICHLVCTPLRVQKYNAKEDAEAAAKLQVASPGVGLKIWGQDANVFYAEVTGGGMVLARDRYHDVEKQIDEIGVSMFAPNDKATAKTATEVVDNTGKRQSKLANYARKFANAIEKALYFTAEYINTIRPGAINLDDAEEMQKMRLRIDYDRLTFTLEQVQFFADLVDTGKLSLDTFLRFLPQVYDMPSGFDPETEMKKIAAFGGPLTLTDKRVSFGKPEPVVGAAGGGGAA